MIRKRVWMYNGCLVIQVIILTYGYVRGKNGIHIVQKLKHSTEQAAQRVVQLQHKIDVIEHEIELWDTHSFYKEKIAREHLHMARRGDVVYYLPTKCG